MAEDKPTGTDDDEPKGTDDDGGTEDDQGGEDDKPTYEELLAERDELQRRVDRARTAKAREARAANRKSGGKKDEPKDDETAQALAERDARIAELEAKANKASALSVAAELGFRNPQYGVRLLDWDEISDPGDEDEVRAAMRALLKADPSLKKSAQRADGGEGGGEGPTGAKSFSDVIRRAAGRG